MYQGIDKDHYYVSENPRDAINGAVFMRQLSEFLTKYAMYVVLFLVICVINFSYLILKGYFGFFGIQTLPNDLTNGIVLAITWIMSLLAVIACAMLVMKSVRNIWLASMLCAIVSITILGLLIYLSLYFLSETSNLGYLMVHMLRDERLHLIYMASLIFGLLLTIYVAMFKNVYHFRFTMTSFVFVVFVCTVLFSFALKPLGSAIARFDTTKDYVQLEDDKCLVVIGYASDRPLVMKCEIEHHVMRIKYQQGYFRLHDNGAVIRRSSFRAVVLDSLFD